MTPASVSLFAFTITITLIVIISLIYFDRPDSPSANMSIEGQRDRQLSQYFFVDCPYWLRGNRHRYVRIRYLGKLDLIQSFGCSIKALEFRRQILVGIVDRIRFVEYLQFFCVDCAPPDEGVEVNDFIPVFIAVQHNRHDLPR